MRNPFGKLCTFQPAFTLIVHNDGALELAVGVVELGLVMDDVLIEISIPDNIGFEPPIICALDRIKEDSVARGWPLKGFVDPMG